MYSCPVFAVLSMSDAHVCRHQKKEETSAAKERQPFDPEKDLQIRKLDQKHTRNVIDGSKLLSSRFGSGPSKFL